MEEDPRLTPRPWWSYDRFQPREYTRPRRSWLGGFGALAVVVVLVPSVLLALSRL